MRSSLTAATILAGAFVLSPCAMGQGIDTGSAELPPDGVYIAPREYMRYAMPEGGILLDDPVLRPLVSTTVRDVIGNDELETFEAQLDAIAMTGISLFPLGAESIALAGPVQVLTENKALSATGSFEAEIVEMTVVGHASFGEILIRESTSVASTGATEITDLGGGLYHIDSFFDVFTELSVDGGENWVSAETSTRLRLAGVSPEPDGLDAPTADLPPDGLYVGPEERSQFAPLGIIIHDPTLRPDVATTQRTNIGNDEVEAFEAQFKAFETGQNLGSIVLTGPVEVLTENRALMTTGSFPTEIVSMSLSGETSFGPITIRESPALPSRGVTDTTDIGGGLYHIDSFFDVFVEMSVDGGASWAPSDTSMRLYLVPPNAPCPEDIDGNGEVGFSDLVRVLSAWGPCP